MRPLKTVSPTLSFIALNSSTLSPLSTAANISAAPSFSSSVFPSVSPSSSVSEPIRLTEQGNYLEGTNNGGLNYVKTSLLDLSNTSVSHDARMQQQLRFNAYLQTLTALFNKRPEFVVNHVPHAESGLGNVINGIMTTAYIAAVTNRSFHSAPSKHVLCVVASSPSFLQSFFLPFPTIDRLAQWKRGRVCHYFKGTWDFEAYFSQFPLFNLSHQQSLCYVYYSDITDRHVNVSLYRSILESNGLIPVVPGEVSASWVGAEFRSLMYRLLLNPDWAMCTRINKHLAELHKRTLIGIQLRMGGRLANYHERPMQGRYAVNVALNEVALFMKRRGLNRNNTFLYISTDSSKVLNLISHIVTSTGIDFVYPMNEYSIGHSSTAKSRKKGWDKWSSFYHRAMMDMFILKDSDYLIWSERSSFGQSAAGMQKAFDNEVSSDEFLKSKGMQCSVYSMRKRAGESFMISLLRGKTEKNLSFDV